MDFWSKTSINTMNSLKNILESAFDRFNSLIQESKLSIFIYLFIYLFILLFYLFICLFFN